MSAPTVEDRIKSILQHQYGIEKSAIEPHHKLLSDLGLDSLDQIELLIDIEDEFSIEISDESAQGLGTVQSVVDFVRAQIKKQGV